MSMRIQMWSAGVMLAAVGGLVYVTSATSAMFQDEKDPNKATKKIAAAIKAGDTAGAKKTAEAAAKAIEEVSELMHAYRPRSKGGLGWSSKEGKNPATDGLEKKIQEFAKGVPATAAAMVDENGEAALWLQALTEITAAKAPAKDGAAGKTKKAWLAFTDEMRTATADFAKAAAKKDGVAMAKSAAKINTTCVGCHSKFKD